MQCIKCRAELIVPNNWAPSFQKHRRYICKDCQRQYYKDNRERRLEVSKAYYKKNRLAQIKYRASKSGLEFTLTHDNMIWPTHCPIFGIELDYDVQTKGCFKHNSPSVDRIDNSKGYTHDNIQVMSFMANAAKGTLSHDEFITIINNRQ